MGNSTPSSEITEYIVLIFMEILAIAYSLSMIWLFLIQLISVFYEIYNLPDRSGNESIYC